MLPAHDPRLPRLIQTTEEAAIHSREGRPEQSVRLFAALLHSDTWPAEVRRKLLHNLATALRQTAAQQLQSRDPAAAGATAAELLALETGTALPPEELRARADVLHNAGTDFMHARHYETATLLLRRAIALYPCPTFSNNLINTLAQTRAPSVLTDYCDAGHSPAPRILLAAQPKSGSTFLKNVLLELTGWRDVYFCHHTELASQDLFYPALLEFLTIPTVTHQHIRATEPNLQLMQAFGITPVVLVRDLFDVTVSLSDHLTGGAVRGTAFDVDTWMQSPPERRLDLVIDHMLPWHLEFLAGWQHAARHARLPIHWLTYEALTSAKPAAIQRVLTFHGLTASEENITAAIARTEATPGRNRFNHGLPGRGATLSADQKHRIRRLAGAFSHADWTPFGL